jgi:hypothetical protein
LEALFQRFEVCENSSADGAPEERDGRRLKPSCKLKLVPQESKEIFITNW